MVQLWTLVAIAVAVVLLVMAFQFSPSARLRRRRRKSHSRIAYKARRPSVRFNVRPPRMNGPEQKAD